MKFLLGFAFVLLATSASVNADLGDLFENTFDDLGDFFKDKGQDWVDSWKTSLENVLSGLDVHVRQQVIKLFEGTKGKNLMRKLKNFVGLNATEKKRELENDEDLKEVLALLQKGGSNNNDNNNKGNGGPGPLALSGFLTTAMMSLFMLF